MNSEKHRRGRRSFAGRLAARLGLAAVVCWAATGPAAAWASPESGDAPPVPTPAPVRTPPLVQPTDPVRPAPQVPNGGPSGAVPSTPAGPLSGLSSGGGGGASPLIRLDVGDVGSDLSLDGRSNSLAPGGLSTPAAAAEAEAPPPASGFNPTSPTGLAVFAGSMLVLGVAAWFVSRRKA